MAKTMTNEELEQMGKSSKQMLAQAVEVWKTAMKTMPINSYQYRAACRAGQATQDLHNSLKIMAEDRGWSNEKLQDVFCYTGYSFS